MKGERIRPLGHSAHVLTRLRDDILDLVLPPGSVLARADLQSRFGVSSTPIRDALLKLEEEGLVDLCPPHVTRVSLIDPARAREGQFLRRSVETEVLRCLVRDGDVDLVARLEAILRRQQVLAGIADIQGFIESDHAFHRALYDAAGVPALWDLVRRQGGHIDRIRRLNLPAPGKTAEIMQDHAAILAAIRDRDEPAATAVLRGHLSRSLDHVDDLRRASPTYFAAVSPTPDGPPSP